MGPYFGWAFRGVGWLLAVEGGEIGGGRGGGVVTHETHQTAPSCL